MSAENTAFVYLGFYGDFDPIAISKLIPLVPNKCEAKHSRNKHARIPRSSILRYAQTGTQNVVPDIYDLADRTVEILLPYEDILKYISAEYCDRVKLQVVMNFTADENISTPVIGFDLEVLRFVSSIGASIDIDTYRV